jgi:hypothetical protein
MTREDMERKFHKVSSTAAPAPEVAPQLAEVKSEGSDTAKCTAGCINGILNGNVCQACGGSGYVKTAPTEEMAPTLEEEI